MRKPLLIARQARRPTGLLGHIVVRVMALESAPENAHTLDLLGLTSGDRVLEIGCGHGHTLYAAAKRVSTIALTGVDFSDVMLRVAQRRNRHFIASGRMTLDRGDSASLPYGDGVFNKIFSMHTIYFWARPEQHLKEIYRTLAPAGVSCSASVQATIPHSRRSSRLPSITCAEQRKSRPRSPIAVLLRSIRRHAASARAR